MTPENRNKNQATPQIGALRKFACAVNMSITVSRTQGFGVCVMMR